MKEVSKKILPNYFEAVKRGVKTFEIRKDEDDIQVGDILILKEWEWETGKYTGRELKKEVAYVLRHIPQYGVQEGYFIIGLKDFNNGWIPCSEDKPKKNGWYECWYTTSVVGENKYYEPITLYWEDNIWLERPNKFTMPTQSDVVAWKPIAPYNPKGE